MGQIWAGCHLSAWDPLQAALLLPSSSQALEAILSPEVDQPSLGAGSACVDYFKQPWNHIVQKSQKANQ